MKEYIIMPYNYELFDLYGDDEVIPYIFLDNE